MAPLLLWRIGAEAAEWTDLATLANRTLAPRLRDGPPRPLGYSSLDKENEAPFPFRRRIVEMLVDFGVLEERDRTPPDAPRWRSEFEVRVTPLFCQLLRFEFGDPGMS